ncbi:MAG: hypothetical protein V3R90_02160 [Limibaculum sp.]
MPADENAPPAAAPSGPPAAADETQVKEVRNALERLADGYEKAAKWHLRKGGIGLIAGFVLAIVLPGFFTVMDVVFENIRDKLSPLAVTAATNKRITEITAEVNALRAKETSFLSEARVAGFGSLAFALAELPAMLRTRAAIRSLSCNWPGELTLFFEKNSAVAFEIVGTLGTDGGVEAVSLVLDGGSNDDCRTIELALPEFQKSGRSIRIDAATLTEDYLLIFGNSDPGRTARLVACSLVAEGAGWPAPCRNLEFPDKIDASDTRWERNSAFDQGMGRLLSGAFIDVYEADGDPEGDDAADRLKMRKLGVNVGDPFISSAITKPDALYLFDEYDDDGTVNIARIAAGELSALGPEASYQLKWQRAPIRSTEGSTANILDIAVIGGDRFLLLQKFLESNTVELSLSGAKDVVSLRVFEAQIATRAGGSIHVDGADTVTVIIDLDDDQSRRDVTRAFSAPVATITRAFEPVAPGSTPTATEIEALKAIFSAATPPWEAGKALVPIRDIAFIDRARDSVIGAEVAAKVDAIDALGDLLGQLDKATENAKLITDEVAKQQAAITLYSTIAARVIVISLILYFVQLEMSLYRYDARLSGHYRARVMAIDYLLATKTPLNDGGFENLFSAIVAIDAREVSAKDPPRLPTDKLFEFLRDLLKARTGPV